MEYVIISNVWDYSIDLTFVRAFGDLSAHGTSRKMSKQLFRDSSWETLLMDLAVPVPLASCAVFLLPYCGEYDRIDYKDHLGLLRILRGSSTRRYTLLLQNKKQSLSPR